MVTTGAATAIALVVLVISAGIGGIVGLLTCWACRLPWSFKVAAWDVGLAAILSVVTAFAGAAIASAYGHLDSGVTWVLLSAAGSVVLRHLIRLLLRSAS